MRLHVALVAVLLLAGCNVPLSDGDDAPVGGSGNLGVENGVSATADLAITTDDGLNESELELVTSRIMARIEVVRQLEFEKTVPVEVITRDEYRDRRGSGGDDAPDPVAEQLWEAAFIVNESAQVGQTRSSVFGTSVLGFFNGSHIVIVTEDPQGFQISRATLVHELEHALQAQHFSLARGSSTHDGRLGGTGIIEGDANYVEYEYEQRCGDEWDCIPAASGGGGGGGGPFNVGYFVSVFTPYSEGPTFVESLKERGGWDAVNDAFRRKPSSTEQVIHPDAYPDEAPETVRVADRTADGWTRVSGDGNGGRAWDVVGEATLYAMFWANGVVSEGDLREGGTEFSPYDYDHPATAGWGGDRVVAYTDGDAYGYVFKSTWDTEKDARQFHRAYLDLLETKNATEVRDGVYRVPDATGYGDAFRVVRTNATVVVVNAPTVDEIDDVHAVNGTGEPATEEEDAIPGFGVPVALAAVLGATVALAVARRRRR